jgi:hypothetical protein
VIVFTCGCGRVAFDARVDSTTDSFAAVTPLAGYPLNEGAGQIATNVLSTASGSLGAMPSADAQDPTWQPGHFGSGLAFDAVDDRLLIAYSQALYLDSVTQDAVAISAWIRPAPGSGFRVVLQIGGESNGASIAIIDTGQLRFALRNVQSPQQASLLDSALTITPDAWYYVAASSSGRGLDLWIFDETGTLLEHAVSANQFMWRTGTDGIAIGNNSDRNSGARGLLNAGEEPFGGIVDEVRIYDVAITEAQVRLDLATPL